MQPLHDASLWTPERLQGRGWSDEQRAFHVARRRMLESQLLPAGIRDEQVLAAMAKMPRHIFVEHGLWEQAYSDRPLNIGEGQTISQPVTVGLMTQALKLRGAERVLEIGTGCGYQAAILCELGVQLYSIERHARLSHRARKHLYSLGFTNFQLRIGDGSIGWAEHAPFDAITCAASGPHVPEELLAQLADGGRLVVPVGNRDQQTLLCITKHGEQYVQDVLSACRFVPLIGSSGWDE